MNIVNVKKIMGGWVSGDLT